MENYKFTIGIDEVGRGPVAGPVAVGAIMVSKENLEKVEKEFDALKIIPQVSDTCVQNSPQVSDTCKVRFRDSKKMTPKMRNEWFGRIKQAKENNFLNYKVIFMDNEKIDKFGIAPSIKTCVSKSLKSLIPDVGRLGDILVLLDGGLKAPEEYPNQKSIIKGDEKELVIALASIVAKVTRDSLMCKFAKEYPEYGLEKHKGYGTKAHMEAIKKYGMCKIHRKTFLTRIKN